MEKLKQVRGVLATRASVGLQAVWEIHVENLIGLAWEQRLLFTVGVD